MDATVTNRARFGSTIAKGQALLQQDLAGGLVSDYALIEFGGNDCSYDWDTVAGDPGAPHQPFTPLDVFERTCRTMIDALKARGITPVLMTLPPIDAQRHFEFITRGKDGSAVLHFLGDVSMIYRFHELYSATIGRIAAATNALLIDVRRRLLIRHDLRALIGLDGIHMTRGGYEQVFAAFRAFVQERRTPVLPMGSFRSFEPTRALT